MPNNTNATRITEIEQRLAAIRTEMDAPDADLDALSTEADNLIDERRRLLDRAEQRRQLLGRIATGEEGREARRFPLADPAAARNTAAHGCTR